MIQINVVGSVSEMDEILDIQTVAKVFVIARRMIDLTNAHGSDIIVTEPPIVKNKKTKKRRTYSYSRLPVLTVKGFNWYIINF